MPWKSAKVIWRFFCFNQRPLFFFFAWSSPFQKHQQTRKKKKIIFYTDLPQCAISSTCRIEIRLVFFVPFRTRRWLILGSDCQDIITTVICSHQSLGTGNCKHLHILPGLWRHKYLQVGCHWRTEQKTPRVSWNHLQSHGAIECKLRVSDGKRGRKLNENRQFRSWPKKKIKLDFLLLCWFFCG